MTKMALCARRPAGVRRGILLVIVAWVVTVAAGLAIVGAVGGSGSATSGTRSGGTPSGQGLPNAAQPLVHAEKVRVTEARRAVGFPVPVPDVAAANQGNLTQAWVKPAWRQVALVFDRGKVTIMMWPALYRDPVKWFHTFIAENHAKIAIGHLNSGPALVITPHTDFYRSNPAWVEFERHGIDVNVVSSSYGTRTLLSVADSMDPKGSATGGPR